MVQIYPIERYANLLAKAVNERVGDRVSDITYKATPERVSGLVEIANEAGLYANRCLRESSGEDYDFEQSPVEFLSKNFPDFRIFSMNFSVFDESFKELRRAIVPYFVHANKKGVKTENESEKAVLDYLTERHISVMRKVRRIKPEILSDCKVFFKKALPYMAFCDWETELSLQAYNRRVLERVSPSFSFEKMLEEGDRNNPRYRRTVLLSWIVGHDAESYEEALESVGKRIQNRSQRLKRLRKINAPPVYIEKEKDMIANAELLRQTLVSERDAVEKFLQR